MRGKRVWIAFALFGMTLVVLLAATGVAMADRAPGSMKGSFQIAEPRPGDRAVYSLSLLVEVPEVNAALQAAGQSSGGQQAFFLDAGARMVVERVQDRVLPSSSGGLDAAASYITTWSTEPFDWGFGAAFANWGTMGTQGYGAQMTSAQFNVEPWSVVHTVGRDVVATTIPAGRATSDLPGRALADDLGVDPEGFVTLFGLAPAPCGFSSDLQGRSHSLAKVVHVEGQCPPAASVLGFAPAQDSGVTVLASGRDEVQGRPAIVFAHTDGASRLRLWFSEEVPYPVRLLTQVYEVDQEIKFHVLYELVEYAPGMGQSQAPPEVAPALAPRALWGPAESGINHPFPLSAAWAAARDEGTLADFLAAHPNAEASSSRFVHWRADEVDEERWTFTVTDGTAALELRVTQRTAPMFYGTLPTSPATPLLQRETTIVVTSQTVSPEGRTPPHSMPGQIPGVAPLHERWLAARTGSMAPQAWAFALCTNCFASWGAAGHASSIEGNLDYSFLGLNAEGSPGFLEESQGPYVVPGESSPDEVGPGWQPDSTQQGWNDPRSYSLQTAGFGFGVWTFPEPETAAGVSFAAALVGVLAYALSPLVKGALPSAGALGLFSRIGPEQVLEHPLRSQILSLVEAEPGLHFQELARRLDTGRGTLEHHLRKLVAADVVSAQATQGFTCYFPKGKMDRRLMAAAPVLKSDGARVVLQAITNQPGRAAQDIATSTGLTPSTVNYHLKRLSAVGLVDTIRSGRFTLLTPTSIGQQALATWSGT